DKDMIDRLLQAWRKAKDVTPRDVAFSLRGASANASLRDKKESIELVWTGPSTSLVPVRHTEQVLCEVIDSAKQQLFIVSFVAYQVDSIISALRRATDRKVQIEVLFENSSEHGGRINHDSASALRQLLSKVNIYSWSSGKQSSKDYLGAVHAKCALADGELAFITSANLTKAAMEINMEAGVLVKGGDLPSRLQDHMNALISTKIIEKI
ncbi:MAG: phospholipase, partial [Candidatus Methylumidiphilus alinenensis]